MTTETRMNGTAEHEHALLPMRELSFDEVQRNPTLLYKPQLPSDTSVETTQTFSKRARSRKAKKSKNVGQSDDQREQRTVVESGRETGNKTQKHEQSTRTDRRAPVSNDVKSPKRNRGEKAKGISSPRNTQTSKKPSEEEKREHAKTLKDTEAFEKAVKMAQMLLFLEKKAQSEKNLFISFLTKYKQIDRQTPIDPVLLLGRQVQGLWTSTRPSTAQISGRNLLIRDVQVALERRWPGCQLRVEPFGSTLTGMLEATSDVDLCLIDPTRPHGVGTPAEQVLLLPSSMTVKSLQNQYVVGIAGVPEYYSVKLIARALEHFTLQGAFRHVLPIAHANVPIVKFDHYHSGLNCDINVNDTFGLRNSEMIRAYLDVAPTIAEPFVFCVKKWASRRGINDPSGQSGIVTLNSYTVVLIALQYLQVRGILPNLQNPALIESVHAPAQYVWQRPKGGKASSQANSQREGDIGESAKLDIPIDSATGARWFDTTFANLFDRTLTGNGLAIAEQSSTNAPSGTPFQQSNVQFEGKQSVDTTLGELLRGFFDWMYDFAYDECGFSLREGHPVRRCQSNDDDSTKQFAHFPLLPMYDARWPHQPILCQDPFIVDRNTCGAVTGIGFNVIMDEIKRAKDILLDVNVTDVPLLSDLLADSEFANLQAYHADQSQQLSAAKREEVYRTAVARGPRKSKMSLPPQSKKRRKRGANTAKQSGEQSQAATEKKQN